MKSLNGSLEKVELLAKRLFDLHPSEGELLIKLLTGDLRIGLKEGLVEEAICISFQANDSDLKHANMLTGDLGRTAVLAKEGRLSEATLTPLVPIRCMLATSLERDGSDGTLKFKDLPFPPPFWLEPKYAGIRVQLHKLGGEIGLFSQDLRPIDGEFPELIEAAAALVGDFVLDGELIAYAEGRKLDFASLQKRLGRRREEGDLFMDAADLAASVPLRFVAFDLLWADGESLLDMTLRERRKRLEKLPLEGVFSRTEVFRADHVGQVEAIFKSVLQIEHEGLIVKDLTSVYIPGGQGKSWIKIKGV